MRGKSRSLAGVSLIEAMTVVALLGILAGVAAPSFQRMLSKHRLQGAAVLMMTDLQSARTEAVLRNAPVTVTVTSTGYSLASGTPSTEIRSVTLGSGTSVTSIPSGSTSTTFTYNPTRGTVSPVGSIVLANGSLSLRISINLMGRVSCAAESGGVSC